MSGSKTVILFFLAILINIWIVPGYAEVTLDTYKVVGQNDEIKLFISGVGEGYSLANAELKVNRKLSPLYCQADKVALNTDNYLQILDNYLSQPEVKAQARPTLSVGMMLLKALQDAFPCK